jgi:hypothetical protein
MLLLCWKYGKPNGFVNNGMLKGIVWAVEKAEQIASCQMSACGFVYSIHACAVI